MALPECVSLREVVLRMRLAYLRTNVNELNSTRREELHIICYDFSLLMSVCLSLSDYFEQSI